MDKDKLIEWLDEEIEKCKKEKKRMFDAGTYGQHFVKLNIYILEKVKEHIESMEDTPIAESTIDAGEWNAVLGQMRHHKVPYTHNGIKDLIESSPIEVPVVESTIEEKLDIIIRILNDMNNRQDVQIKLMEAKYGV